MSRKKRRDNFSTTFDLVVKDGNTPIIKVKKKDISELDEVIAVLRKKL